MVVRKGIEVSGVVQGVGFRPHVYRLATERHLAGQIRNTPAGVDIEIHGESDVVEDFIVRLSSEAPPLSRITDLHLRDLPSNGERKKILRKQATNASCTVSIRILFSSAHDAKTNASRVVNRLEICRTESAKEIGIVGHFGWHTFRHTYATLLKGNGEDVKVVQELMRHANISVTLNIYAQAITQTKRDAQSRVVSLLLDKNEEKPGTEAYRTVTDLQNSGGDSQVADKVGVPDGI